MEDRVCSDRGLRTGDGGPRTREKNRGQGTEDQGLERRTEDWGWRTECAQTGD